MVLVMAMAMACREYTFEGPSGPVSSTVVALEDSEALVAVNVDEGTVSRLTIETGKVDRVEVGIEPTRLTRAGERVFVTLRGQREVVALDDGPNGLVEGARETVGAEPYGIVTAPEGGPVYVAVSLEDKVLELDPTTLETVRTFNVPNEPRWLTLDPEGPALFVASHRGGLLTRIDLLNGYTSEVVLPQAERGLFGEESDSEGDGTLDVRLTGDPCVTINGDYLVVPALYVDTVATILGDEGGGGSGYSGGGAEIGRMNPGLVLYPLDRDLNPGNAELVFAVGDDSDDVRRTSLTSATCTPDGWHVLTTMEATDTVLLVDLEPFRRERNNGPKSDMEVGFFGFGERPVTDIRTGRGPRGVAFVGSTPYVHTWLDREVAHVAWDDAMDINELAARDNKLGFYPVVKTHGGVMLTESALSPDELAGRDLFTSAIDDRMTTVQGGVSCSTCHVDGREDGISWPFENGRRQTLSLAGGVADTGPFTWDGNVPSIGEEARRTTTIRMGGQGPNADEQALIEAYVATLRAPDTVNKGLDNALVNAGRLIFESPAVGCSACHAGGTFTDGAVHPVYGTTPTNTPSLAGVAASAPYLHDGSVGTLRDVLEWAKTGAMGNTSQLDENDMDALEAYLRSL